MGQHTQHQVTHTPPHRSTHHHHHLSTNLHLHLHLHLHHPPTPPTHTTSTTANMDAPASTTTQQTKACRSSCSTTPQSKVQGSKGWTMKRIGTKISTRPADESTYLLAQGHRKPFRRQAKGCLSAI